MMRAFILAAAAAVALSACGSANEADEANTLTADNMAVDQNVALDEMNADANLALDPATENMINQDLNTNDADTNLANGM